MDEGVHDMFLSKQNIDRAIMARLMMDPAEGLQRPFPYLLDVYARTSKEFRSIATYKDKDLVQQLQSTALQAQELAVSHANLVLTMDLFPRVCSLVIKQNWPGLDLT